jgi:hypothetical protein
MNSSLDKNGFMIIPEVFSSEQIQKMRDISLNYFKEGGGFSNAGGFAKPDWIKDERLRSLVDLYNMEEIKQIVSSCVGESVEFAEHNDLHLNRSVGWHKDRLNGSAREFEINSPWEEIGGQTMKIYKVNLYLQDHAKNSDGLTVRVGSHKFPQINRGIIRQIKPSLGDIVLFDQRISHKASWSGGYERLLICVGFGVKNIFFDQFKKGTQFRQDKQNNG